MQGAPSRLSYRGSSVVRLILCFLYSYVYIIQSTRIISTNTFDDKNRPRIRTFITRYRAGQKYNDHLRINLKTKRSLHLRPECRVAKNKHNEQNNDGRPWKVNEPKVFVSSPIARKQKAPPLALPTFLFEQQSLTPRKRGSTNISPTQGLLWYSLQAPCSPLKAPNDTPRAEELNQVMVEPDR